MVLARGPRDLICSTRECEEKAVEALVWRNPKIPTGRTKTWLSCADHVPHLREYLAYRHFPVEQMSVEAYLDTYGEVR